MQANPGKGCGEEDDTRPIAILFTGGKDSVYTLLKARKDLGGIYKAVIIEPSLPQPNPHTKNINIVVEIAKLLETHPVIVSGGKPEELVKAVNCSRAIVAGDIYLLDHVEWLSRVAEEAGIPIVYEPLFNADTRRLLKEVVYTGIEFTVIGVGHKDYADLIGFHVTKKTLPAFLELIDKHGIDPMGEYAEYHTFINKAPGYQWRIKYNIKNVKTEAGWLYSILEYKVTL
ncbi:MAG: hypothetical protein GSR86_05315 [Desulfurococcales archaeon]|nr:hypothetical protein [Desulfurococcales archaeon]